MVKNVEAPQGSDGLPRVIAIILTLVLLFGTAILLIWVVLGNVTDALWLRVITLFNVFTGLGYAGAGYLFGHQVQQVNLSEAKKQMADAQQKVSEMKREASLALQTEFTERKAADAAVRAPDPALASVEQHLRNILEK
jgi:hypothetical protein